MNLFVQTGHNCSIVSYTLISVSTKSCPGYSANIPFQPGAWADYIWSGEEIEISIRVNTTGWKDNGPQSSHE